jgi:hypothetical protein
MMTFAITTAKLYTQSGKTIQCRSRWALLGTVVLLAIDLDFGARTNSQDTSLTIVAR